VWLDYFALAAIPLAIARPRLSSVWFVPLATIGAEGAGWKIGDVFDIVRVLAAFIVVLGVAASRPRSEPIRFTADPQCTATARPSGRLR
jgi:hypothetical protein